MRLTQMGKYLKENWKLFSVILFLGIVLLIISYVSYSNFKAIRQAKQEPSMVNLEEQLQKGNAVVVEINNWAEKKAMEQIVNHRNGTIKENVEYYRYSIYETEKDTYFIISQYVYDKNFSMEAAEYFFCLADMLVGFRSEEEQYLFYYVNDEQKWKIVQKIIRVSEPAKQELDIKEEMQTLGEVTFIVITVKPKENFVIGEHLSRCSPVLTCN